MQKDDLINLIKDLIGKTVIPVEEIVVSEGDFLHPNKKSKTNSIWFRVQTKDPYPFINRGGEAISALNHLARKIIESKVIANNDQSKDNTFDFEVMIDINDFQKKKIENLLATVHMMAERARYFKSNIEIDPMSAFERRIVHEFLSEATDLKTESQGEGRDRRVVIKYISDAI